MNFITVREANGKNVIMLGQIIEFKGEGVGATGKPWKKVIAEDDYGERHTVTIRGNLPPADAVNKPAQFTLSTYQGTYQGQPYMGYSGFCDIMPDYGQSDYGQPATQQQGQPQGVLQSQVQPGPQAQQQPQQRQGVQQRPQQAQRPQPAPRDYNKENRGKCRFGFYQALLQAGVEPKTLNEEILILEAVEELVEKAMNGLPAPQRTFKQAADEAPKMTMDEAIQGAETHRDSKQAEAAGRGEKKYGPGIPEDEVPF